MTPAFNSSGQSLTLCLPRLPPSQCCSPFLTIRCYRLMGRGLQLGEAHRQCSVLLHQSSFQRYYFLLLMSIPSFQRCNLLLLSCLLLLLMLKFVE